MTIHQWIKTPKGIVAMIMGAYLLIASTWSHDMKGLVSGLISVGTAVAVDVIYGLAEKRKRIFPDGAVITGLIVALILSTSTSWFIIALTACIAILSKHMLVYRKKPVFNPAAFGLLLSILIFQTGQSWWGAFGDLPVIGLLLILAGGYFVSNRVQKFPLIFSFFGISFVLLLLLGYLNLGQAADALRPPFINATLFFGFFMLTDLPTSPAKPADQMIYGIIAAAVGVAIYAVFGGLAYLFIGLLAANAYHMLRMRSKSSASRFGSANVKNNKAGSQT